MADGRANNGGKRDGAGNPGYGQLVFISNKVKKYSETWWTQIGAMMESDKLEAKKFALMEFNKIQVKLIPQDITTKGEKIETAPIYGGESNK